MKKKNPSLVFKKQNTRNAMKMKQCYLIKQHKKLLKYKILHFIVVRESVYAVQCC